MIKIEVFTHESSLDLNMRYYRIGLYPGAKQLCTVELPWGGGVLLPKPTYGGCNIPDIFQEIIYDLFEVFGMVYT